MNSIATTTTDDDDQCMQFYHHHQQPFMDISMEGFSHATMITTSPTMSSNGHLTPKNNTFKPIRKRSRASKKTPITLLNANSTNFRALVQQFTGCPTPTIKSAMSFATHKGPITLNFQQAHQVPVPQSQQLIPKQQLMQEQYQSQSNFLPTGLEVSDYGLPMNNNLSNVLYM